MICFAFFSLRHKGFTATNLRHATDVFDARQPATLRGLRTSNIMFEPWKRCRAT